MRNVRKVDGRVEDFNKGLLCPKCAKKTMMIRQLKNGRYSLVCLVCGKSRDPFGVYSGKAAA